MWVFWLTVSFVVGVPSLVALGFYVFDPPYSVTEKRKDRKAARVYKKGMILRKMWMSSTGISDAESSAFTKRFGLSITRAPG